MIQCRARILRLLPSMLPELHQKFIYEFWELIKLMNCHCHYMRTKAQARNCARNKISSSNGARVYGFIFKHQNQVNIIKTFRIKVASETIDDQQVLIELYLRKCQLQKLHSVRKLVSISQVRSECISQVRSECY